MTKHGLRSTNTLFELSESKLMPNLFNHPGKEDKGRPDLDGGEFDLVENPVRIEAAALHKISLSQKVKEIVPPPTAELPSVKGMFPGVYPEFWGRDAQRPKNQSVKVFHKWPRQFPHSTAPKKLDSAT